MKKLMLLLARMGFRLENCKQKFQYMNVEIKRKMKEEFEEFLPEYGLNDFYYRGFCLLHGYSSRISSADVVYGVTALLESFVESDGSCASKQFGVAYDALSLSKFEKLETGMQHAIKIQRAILRQGSSATTKKGSIRSGSKFRWVKLEDSIDTKLLGYPQALTKFGHFLMDALREKGANMKPLICVCYTQDRSKVLIVGVCGKPRLGADKGNAFGIAFRDAAEETGADFFHELFESSWIVLDTLAINSLMIRLTENLCLEIEALAGEILMAICDPLSFLAAGIMMLEVIEGSIELSVYVSCWHNSREFIDCIDVSAGIEVSVLGAGLIFQLGNLIGFVFLNRAVVVAWVNRIRELPQNNNIVALATHTDCREVLIWDVEANLTVMLSLEQLILVQICRLLGGELGNFEDRLTLASNLGKSRMIIPGCKFKVEWVRQAAEWMRLVLLKKMGSISADIQSANEAAAQDSSLENTEIERSKVGIM
ncbi:hypothetical protein TEA_001033 [Camellia sinensis var. sinensis]|uniref:Uncharacterized protein n=1 Tax=Camellia sinensis var. sinensis TaxID=542762 RepID=A0A4S4E8F4_CAMSN|nr:hypothetical protein TEA_001033 [Camellia sinensis var. sinensis]